MPDRGHSKTVLTTGDVAKICSVAPRTVSKWFDSGDLRGYRIPGSKDRRIPINHLIKFMRAHGIPLNGLDAGALRVLILDGDSGLREAMRSALEKAEGFEVFTAETALEAGAVARDREPQVVVMDVSLPDVDPPAVVRFFRSTGELSGTCLIGMVADLSEGQGQALLQLGFDGYLAKPFSTAALLSLVERHAAAAVGS